MMSPSFQTVLSEGVFVGNGTVRCRELITLSLPRTYRIRAAASVSLAAPRLLLRVDALLSANGSFVRGTELSTAVKIVREGGSLACRKFPASQMDMSCSKGTTV